uniref:Uncharacterized protein n=1 Tax=Arion vulgaris TaxID=1028688 RepID=A0A0B7BII6_9EUPU
MRTCTFSVATYRCESQTITQTLTTKIKCFETKCNRKNYQVFLDKEKEKYRLLMRAPKQYHVCLGN